MIGIPLRYYYGDYIREDQMGGTCGQIEEKRNS